MSAVYKVTPPGISSFVPLIYRMLVSDLLTHTTSETEESKGASVMSPLATSKMCQVVDALCEVQLYLVDENRANSCSH